MKFSKTLLSSVVLAFISDVTASFPGSTFGIVYNSSSYPSSGHLKTFSSPKAPSPQVLLTTISSTTPDIGGYFTSSGTEGYLNNACNTGTAALIRTHDIPGLQYVLGWTKILNDLPEGSISSGFQLASPAYDTIENIHVTKGSWVVQQADTPNPLVGWSDGSDNSNSGTAITLVKTGVNDIVC